MPGIIILQNQAVPTTFERIALRRLNVGRRRYVNLCHERDLQRLRDALLSADAVLSMGSSFDPTPAAPCFASLVAAIGICADERIPFMGMCFTHQVMSMVHGGTVSRHHAEYGTVLTFLTDDGARDSLLGPFSSSAPFLLFESHEWSATCPSSASLLAYSDSCPVQIIRYSPTMLSAQSHPEITRRMAAKQFVAAIKSQDAFVVRATRRDATLSRLSHHELVQKGERGELFAPTPIGPAMLTSFVASGTSRRQMAHYVYSPAKKA